MVRHTRYTYTSVQLTHIDAYNIYVNTMSVGWWVPQQQQIIRCKSLIGLVLNKCGLFVVFLLSNSWYIMSGETYKVHIYFSAAIWSPIYSPGGKHIYMHIIYM